MKKEVIDYLTGLGFQIQPCSVPLNDKEYIKRNLFIMIRRKSEFLFRLLIKWFPIITFMESLFRLNAFVIWLIYVISRLIKY